MMRFYDQQHEFYCGVDLHTRKMYLCVLGHALYMKAIHGGKNKDDRIDSEKIARLMRGGTFPLSYVYAKTLNLLGLIGPPLAPAL